MMFITVDVAEGQMRVNLSSVDDYEPHPEGTTLRRKKLPRVFAENRLAAPRTVGDRSLPSIHELVERESRRLKKLSDNNKYF